MSRVKGGVTSHARHRKIVKQAAGYYGARSTNYRTAKQAVDSGLEVDLQTGLEIERSLFAGLFATNDQKAGMRSFMENGPGKATFDGT